MVTDSTMELQGFFSYARDDNTHLGQVLTELRDRIAGEVSMLLGRDVSMFQDIHDLRTGDNWEEKLRDRISSAAFLVPVLTPRFFTRNWCREETITFLKLSKEKNISPLIFPVLFIEDEFPEPECSVRAALKPFQYKDFKNWRFSGEIERRRLENAFAKDISARLHQRKQNKEEKQKEPNGPAFATIGTISIKPIQRIDMKFSSGDSINKIPLPTQMSTQPVLRHPTSQPNKGAPNKSKIDELEEEMARLLSELSQEREN
jgi:hypothetical protein